MRAATMAVLGLLMAGHVPPASAQVLPRAVSVGVKAGFNQVQRRNETFGADATGNLKGLIAGGFVTIPLGRLIAVQPEVLYSMRRVSISSGEAAQTVHINDLVLPVLARVSIGNRGPFAVIGPEFAFDLSASGTFEGPSFRSDAQIPKSNDIGIAFGVGADFRPVVIEIRYTVGLRDLTAQVPRIDGLAIGATMQRTIALTAGIRF